MNNIIYNIRKLYNHTLYRIYGSYDDHIYNKLII